MKLSYKLKIVAVIAIACVVALKAYDKQNMNISDVVLANVEALADKSEIDNGGVGGIVCSAKCNDGIGRCWIDTGKTCILVDTWLICVLIYLVFQAVMDLSKE